ncbi:MAG: hypothetical protein JO327_12410 [Nitrososphaeraceae archaeon]|nr:hypothetical protein [Nitrososphaeraceae archaeon]
MGDTFLEGKEQERIQKIIQLLEKAVTQNGIRIRILASKNIYKQIEKLIAIQRKNITKGRQDVERRQEGRRGLVGVGKQEGRFEIHLADTTQQQQQQRLQNKVSFLVVDSKLSLVEEEPKAYTKDNNNSNEKISLATFSNSESTILAYISIFETLWTQSELEIKV